MKGNRTEFEPGRSGFEPEIEGKGWGRRTKKGAEKILSWRDVGQAGSRMNTQWRRSQASRHKTAMSEGGNAFVDGQDPTRKVGSKVQDPLCLHYLTYNGTILMSGRMGYRNAWPIPIHPSLHTYMQHNLLAAHLSAHQEHVLPATNCMATSRPIVAVARVNRGCNVLHSSMASSSFNPATLGIAPTVSDASHKISRT